MNRSLHGLALLTALALGGTLAAARAPFAEAEEVAAILSGLAERTQRYYDRFISIICIEAVHQQDLKFNLEPVGRPRQTVFELSVTRDPKSKDGNDFRVERTLLSVNGRPAKKDQEPGCTDPKTGTPEPLGFLLARHQLQYRFTLNDRASGGPAGTRAIDFVQTPPDRVQIKWNGNCFDAEGGGEEGRVWFDRKTFDVIQIDARLSKPFLVPVPSGIFGIQPSIRVERSEVVMRFSRVKFEKPDETVLLPESIETLTVFRGVPSMRTIQKLSNFRRFLAESTLRTADF